MPDTERPQLLPCYTYVLVRTDIPLADQLAQVGHACLEAGRRFSWPGEPCHIVVLAIPSEDYLLDAISLAEASGVRCALFYEPDDHMGYTAACTQPVTRRHKGLFRRFPLWSAHLARVERLAATHHPL